jgi:predicted TIM-barrel fold metal-dependent hydrolase
VSPAEPVVDAHHHVWDFDRFYYPWLQDANEIAIAPELEPIRRTYGIDETMALYRRCGIVKTVHVQADTAPVQALDETAWVQAIGDRHGLPTAIVAWVDLENPHLEADLEAHLQHQRVRGVRMVPRESLDGVAFRRGLKILADHELSYDLTTNTETLTSARELAETFEGLELVLPHAGGPPSLNDASLSEWRRAIAPFSSCENVSVKISGFGMVESDWSVERFRPWVTTMLEVFGADRCMIGTNWPVDSITGRMETFVSIMRELLAEVSASERAFVLSGTAERVYRLDRDPLSRNTEA